MRVILHLVCAHKRKHVYEYNLRVSLSIVGYTYLFILLKSSMQSIDCLGIVYIAKRSQAKYEAKRIYTLSGNFIVLCVHCEGEA